MSALSSMRRSDKAMSDVETLDVLQRGFCGRLAVIGADGYPYCVPMIYVWMNGEIRVHNTKARGHLRTCVDNDARACFEVDEPGSVFPYGRFECDTTLAYRSIIAFGKIRVVEDLQVKQEFFTALMQKYARPEWNRPKDFFPRIEGTTLYALAVETMTGKATPMPELSEQWPARDRSMTPNARPTIE